MDSMEDVFGPVISRYSRAQAIEDGILVDPEAPGGDLAGMAKEAGIGYPIAITATAFMAAVWPIDGEGAGTADRKRLEDAGQDPKGRWWDVLTVLRLAIRHAEGGEVVHFAPYVLRAGHRSPKPLRLKAVCGPADDCSPCITIMLPEED